MRLKGDLSASRPLRMYIRLDFGATWVKPTRHRSAVAAAIWQASIRNLFFPAVCGPTYNSRLSRPIPDQAFFRPARPRLHAEAVSLRTWPQEVRLCPPQPTELRGQ